MISILNVKKKILFCTIFFAILGIIPPLSPSYYYSRSIIVLAILFVITIPYVKRTSYSKLEINILVAYTIILFLSSVNSPIKINLLGLAFELIPIWVFLLIRTLKVDFRRLYEILILLFVLSSFFGYIQFFLLPQYVLDVNLNQWYEVTSELPLLMKRPGSIQGNPNVFGVFNAIIITLVLHFEYSKKRNLFLFLGLINIIIIAKSRSSAVVALLVYTHFLYNQKKYLLLTFMASLSSLGTILVFYFFRSNPELDQIFRISDLFFSERNSFTIREEIYLYSISKIWEYPLLGIGAGNIVEYFQLLNAPHNGPESAGLHTIIEKGILGYLFYFIGLTILLFKKHLLATPFFIIFIVSGIFETVTVQSQIFSIALAILGSSLNSSTNAVQ